MGGGGEERGDKADAMEAEDGGDEGVAASGTASSGRGEAKKKKKSKKKRGAQPNRPTNLERIDTTAKAARMA